jgi:hypothetical protein
MTPVYPGRCNAPAPWERELNLRRKPPPEHRGDDRGFAAPGIELGRIGRRNNHGGWAHASHQDMLYITRETSFPKQRPARLHADPCFAAAELDRSKKLTYRVVQIGSASCGGFPFRECVVVPSQNRPLTCQDHGGTEDLAPKTPLGQNHPNIHAVARPET